MQNLMAVKIIARSVHAPQVQDVLTKYGCNIKMRLGFHETSETTCSTDGFIIMQLAGNTEEINDLYEELNSIDDVTAKFIEF